jgi:hypothetical protein
LVAALIGWPLLGAKLGRSPDRHAAFGPADPQGPFCSWAPRSAGSAASGGPPAASEHDPVAATGIHASAPAVVCIAAPLLFVGGLVTSTNSGMAAPDWPATYGMNMFLYPLGRP